jgi:hypothetical protein
MLNSTSSGSWYPTPTPIVPTMPPHREFRMCKYDPLKWLIDQYYYYL